MSKIGIGLGVGWAKAWPDTNGLSPAQTFEEKSRYLWELFDLTWFSLGPARVILGPTTPISVDIEYLAKGLYTIENWASELAGSNLEP